MSVVPKKFPERITFFLNHIAPLTTNATAIGLTTAEVTDLQAKTEAAQAALTARDEALQTAEAATVSLHDAVDVMSSAGAALIKKIRAKAEQTGDNSVYALAQLPPPATPAPVGAPGKPYEFTVQLGENGALTLKWKCNNPVGCNLVQYQLWRKVDGGEFTYIGGCGQKLFVDATLAAGAANITYQMQATRSTAVGPWAQFNVNVGTGGTTVTETQPAAKLAA